MLTDLRITGLALLEDCYLELSPGLTAITGETGAGKTMVLTALRLLSGGRADPKIVKSGRKRTEVDAILEVPAAVAVELEEAGFDLEDGAVTISRTVASSRSRAALAGRPVPARRLQETTEDLIAIHGQADQWRLKSSTHQRSLLDAYAPQAHARLLTTYRARWDEVSALRSKVKELHANRDQREMELRYLREVTAEIEELNPAEDEEERLDTVIDRLSNIEQLRRAAIGAVTALTGDHEGSFGVHDTNVVDSLGTVSDTLNRAAPLDSDLKEFADRAHSLEVEAAALASDMRDYSDILYDDPEELARLHTRRATLTELLRGRARDTHELLGWADQARKRISELESDDEDPVAVQRALEAGEHQLKEAACALTRSRKDAAETLGSKVNAELAALALPTAALIVAVEPATLGPHGGDRIDMLLQPHPSAPRTPLGQGASGGELSRIMLALEVVLAAKEDPQTMVFDEVDAGIGGLTANQVGQRLKHLSQFHQVIVVTHLPQIAALADTNFVVEKRSGSAVVRRVQGEARTDEIVRMLGGDDQTGAARHHALELEAHNLSSPGS